MYAVGRFAVVLFVVAASAASAETFRPVSVSFVPGLSTNGTEFENVTSAFSLNIIGGSIGSVRGCELGGVFNIERHDMFGYQGAGVFSIVGGRVGGLQQAGVFNIVDGRSEGVQQAGVFNIVGSSFTGVQQAGVINVVDNEFGGAQMAGVVNVVGEGFTGAQLAGVANVTGNGFLGAQLAGVANVAGEQLAGLQMSGVVNIADEFNGAQVGLVNITDRGRGLQLGLVNIAEDVDVPIGLVSIVENGMFRVNAWATEFAPVNIGVKAGSNTIYNVFMFGVRPRGDSTRLFCGIGLGGHIPIRRFFVDIDVLNQGVAAGPVWFPEGAPEDLLSSLRVTGGWQVTDFLSVTAGPSVSVWISDTEDGSTVPYYDAPLFQHHGTENIRIWPGFTVGLQLL